MLAVSSNLAETISRSRSLDIKPAVLAEWEVAGFYQYSVSGATSIDPALFPLADIFYPNRPLFPGAPKAVVRASRVTGNQSQHKYRMATEDSPYKYFRSLQKSGTGGTISSVIPQIMFTTQARMNKIVVQFENSWAQPTSVTLFVTTNGSTWTNIGNYTPDSTGYIRTYFNGTSWSSTRVLGHEANIRGVRVAVNSMGASGRAVDIISISPRLEIDLTSRVVSVDTDFDREQVDIDSPIGVMQANVCTVNLENMDGHFNPQNTSSPYYGIIDENVRIYPSIRVRRNDGTFEEIAQGVFFSDDWNVGDDGLVSVTCTDQSKFLQEKEMTDCFYEGKTAEYIIDDILERHGYGRAIIRQAVTDPPRRIPFVWFTNEDTVWDALTQIAKAEAGSFYFNEEGRFVYETRDWLFGVTQPHYTLRGDNSGLDLANIENLIPEFSVSANDITVTYPKYGSNKYEITGKDNVLWSQSDDALLRIRPLTRNISAGTDFFHVGANEGRFWPPEGVVNIEGEYIRYARDMTSDNNFRIVKRGEYGSPIFDHRTVTRPGWSVYTYSTSGKLTERNMTNGDSFSYSNSQAIMRAGGYAPSTKSMILLNGTLNTSYQMYGTMLSMPVSYNAQGEPVYTRGGGFGGMILHAKGDRRGLYFELRRSGTKGFGLTVYKHVNNTTTMHEILGRSFDWHPGDKVSLMVIYNRDANSYTVYLNGQVAAKFVHYDATLGKDGYFGTFIRGSTTMAFEHFFTINNFRVAGYIDGDLSRYQDRVNGGFAGDYALREWSRSTGDVKGRSEWFFEDFGAMVREAREFNVRHDVFPSRSADIFMSNDSKVSTIYHHKSPFSSKFAIVNSAFTAAWLKGTEQLSQDESLNHEMFVFGDPIVELDKPQMNIKDEPNIRRRGRKELEIESSWIQTDTRARRIADFIIQRWGEPVDVINVETIIIPQLQVGDLVAVQYARRNMTSATHRYHVIAIARSYGNSHSQSLKLRRAYI